jgi:hypothetical protein
MTTAYCWGSAVFVAFGDEPWTEDDADAFIERVKAIALLEQRRDSSMGFEIGRLLPSPLAVQR